MTYKKSIIIYSTDRNNNYEHYKICNWIDNEDIIDELQNDEDVSIGAVIDLTAENIEFMINQLRG